MANKNSKLKGTNLDNIVNEVILEIRRHGYGHDEINSLHNDLNHDEDVWLSDNTGDLSGEVVRKAQYLKNMLNDAIRKEDWGLVHQAILYLDIKMI